MKDGRLIDERWKEKDEKKMMKEEDEKVMFALQDEILDELVQR